jgi:hypothetical protein
MLDGHVFASNVFRGDLLFWMKIGRGRQSCRSTRTDYRWAIMVAWLAASSPLDGWTASRATAEKESGLPMHAATYEHADEID